MPALVFAAPGSGQGKTTVATGVAAALARRGRKVAPFKVGPDYIDPGYHAVATGRQGRNLDPFLVGEERIGPLFAHGANGADIAILEGVMGLYDGASGRGEFASTAHVAKLLGAPVVLVVDASSQGRSVAALVTGFRDFDPDVNFAGVVLNRVGSDRHEAILREALAGIPILGVVRRAAEASVPSRHLGLIPAAERDAEAKAVIDVLAALMSESVDLDALTCLAAPVDFPPWSAEAEVSPVGHPRIAVAGGAAFTFGYAENVELLCATGAEVVEFDPLVDEQLPEGVGGLVIGGGFPEVYANALAANARMLKEVARFAASGKVIAAECAGLLYLCRSLDGLPMCGVLDADAVMTSTLTLGYREAVAETDSVIASAGELVRGHEFHRTAVRLDGPAAWRWRRDGGSVTDGVASGRVHASYLHLHWAGRPEIARRFAGACEGVGR